MDVDQLLGHDGLPVELLTDLTGGRLKVASSTARDWLDQAGCRLRTIVLDDTGQILGVGRAVRQPPGWLEQATRATDATCRAPGCRTAASVCDLDHHTPWHPRRPDDTPGGTDADNLGPVCRTDNTAKHHQGWDVERLGDGTIGWTHPRTGIHLRTIPWATARAAARHRRDRHPPDPRPPDRPRGRGRDRPSPLERELHTLLARGRDPDAGHDDGHDPPPF
jgi:hypothetical protein